MNKSELIKHIASTAALTQAQERAARTGRNPKTGEELQIAAAKVPSFKAGKALKEAVSNGNKN